MYANQFSCTLLAFKCSTFFSDQKCVFNFPKKDLSIKDLESKRFLDSRSFIFKLCVTQGLHYCEKSYEKSRQII